MEFNRRQLLKAMGAGSIGLASGVSVGSAELGAASKLGAGSRVDYSQDIIYQVLTDRIRDGDSSNNPDGELYDDDCSELTKYCGGDWQGLIDKIKDGYIPDMGVTALWISPPFENVYEIHPDYDSAAYHGYWVRDLKSTNPFFGDMNEFEELVDVAHDHGIKIVMDFIPNHSNPANEEDPSFMEDGALYDAGDYVASYNDDPGYFRHNGGIDFDSDPSYEETIYKNLYDLPDYDLQSDFMDSYIKEAIELWLDMGIDGLRIDAVAHISPEWQKTLMDTIYEHRPVFTFGEWFLGGDESDPRYYEFSNESGMSLLDFRYGQEIQQVLRDWSDDWYGFWDVIEETEAEHDQVIDQVTFLDNHDMDRFSGEDTVWSYKNTEMALAVLLTSRGVPNIYYGTEQYMIGANEPGNPANRAKMTSFDQSTTAYKVIQKLAPLRKNNPALAYGDTEQRWINSDVLYYEREFGDNVVLVAINRSDEWHEITGLQTALPAGSYADELDGILDGHELSVNGDGSVDSYWLGPQTVSVWSHRGDTASPTLGHVGPTMGTPGNTVVISGEGFGDYTGSVQFGGTDANVVSWSDTEIEVTVPSVGGGEYSITVTDADGVQSNSFDHFEVLTANQVSVRFVVREAYTDTGEDVYVVGNVPELGSWDADQAVGPFFNQVEHEYPDWYYDVSVPEGTDLEFKFIKKDGNGNVTWESGDNRTYTTPVDSTGEYDDYWK